LAADLTKDQELRLEAWNVLAVKDFTFVVGALRNAAESGAIREAAGKALAGVNQPAARDALVAALPTAPSKLAATIAQGLAGSKQSAEQMCLVVEKGQASPRLLADRTVRQKLEAHGLKDRVDQLTHGLPPMDKQVEELIAKKRDQFQKASPNVSAGKELFTKHCAVCHQVGGQGAKVGPQLDGIDVRGLDRLLEDTLDPSRNVDPTFRMTNLQLSDGRALSGLFLREEGASLIFADNQGKEFTVKKDQIEQRTVSPLSAMPTNVAESLKDDEFAALLAYLLSLKK
jgi:putative heme-binding domain-containing protein